MVLVISYTNQNFSPRLLTLISCPSRDTGGLTCWTLFHRTVAAGYLWPVSGPDMGLQQPICHGMLSALSLKFHLLSERSWGQENFNSMCFCLEYTAQNTDNIVQISYREWILKGKIVVELYFFLWFFFIDKHVSIINELHGYRYICLWSMCSYTIWGTHPRTVMVFRNPQFFSVEFGCEWKLEAPEDLQVPGMFWCTYSTQLRHLAVQLFCN